MFIYIDIYICIYTYQYYIYIYIYEYINMPSCAAVVPKAPPVLHGGVGVAGMDEYTYMYIYIYK